ncbi:hypothetical protein Trco_003397 [Trichoderma cornu-damae]|uniref:Uncharacterized protein n=1 Tax=Trichoderma cornu-damae TaxID=654480 RepID=A0A9P8TVY6_9HYPO|nr:hypothetical protein Trco_003397 [Trichoderma cornu-damae]
MATYELYSSRNAASLASACCSTKRLYSMALTTAKVASGKSSLAHAARGHGLLQGEARPVAYGSVLLHLDKLAEIGESHLHLGVQVPQRRSLDGPLEELARKGGVHSQARIAAKGRFLVGAVIVGVGRGGRDGDVRLWRVDELGGVCGCGR